MERRDFLKVTGAGAASLVFAGGCATSSLADNKKEEPLFSFMQLTDTHLQYPFEGKGVYSEVNRRIEWFLESLDNGTIEKPDFIIHTGDMISGGKLEKLGPDMKEFDTKFLKNLPVPFYPCVGNHENCQRAGVAEYEEPYIKVFGKDKINYTFEHGGIVFVVFDNSSDPPRKTFEQLHKKVRRERNEWLRKVLAENQDKPKILCCHIPVVCIREDAVLEKSFGFPSWYSHDEELVKLLSANNDTILAVLSGHLHLTGCVKVDGIYHIVPSGLASYPHDFAVYKVYPDRIDVCMNPVPKELSKPYKSDIHGIRRHKIDYVDKGHLTHESYVCGNSDERVFSIPLKNI